VQYAVPLELSTKPEIGVPTVIRQSPQACGRSRVRARQFARQNSACFAVQTFSSGSSVQSCWQPSSNAPAGTSGMTTGRAPPPPPPQADSAAVRAARRRIETDRFMPAV